MEETKKEAMEKVEKKKLSYEELENAARQLSEQNAYMRKQLQEMNMSNVLSRLNFLFKVMEFRAAFSKEFVTKSTEEIESLMTIPEEPEEE